MIEFENPAAFLLALFPLFVFILRSMKVFTKISFPLNLSDWDGEDFKWKSTARAVLSAVSRIFLLAAYLSTVASLAKPVIHRQQKMYSSRGAAIIFVVDVSPSMASRDMDGKRRIDAAKNAIFSMAGMNSGDEMGLIEMARTSAVIVPPTMDRNLFYSRLENMSIGELGDGTAIGTGISSAVYHFERSYAPKKSIVLITDGENNAGAVHPYTAAQLALSKGISLYVLGIGTKGTVPLDYVDPKTGKTYSGYLESNFDSAELSRIANEANGKYFEIESVASLTRALLEVSKAESVVQSYHIKNEDLEYYIYFVYASLALAAAAWFIRRIILLETL